MALLYPSHFFLDSNLVAPELAVAFAISRPLRRLRLPLELACAAPLAKAFPGLTELKVGSLAKRALPEMISKKIDSNSIANSGVVVGLANIIDKYGAAYVLSARFVGVGIVGALYYGKAIWSCLDCTA